MIYTEAKMDLFKSSPDCALVHCISSDFKMGAGIARTFSDIGVKRELIQNYKQFWNGEGYCLHSSAGSMASRFPYGVYNLVTKEKYFHKPTLYTMQQALESLKCYCMENGTMKISMPTIGCGLDRLEWKDVSDLIQKTFDDTDIQISVAIFEKIQRKEMIGYFR